MPTTDKILAEISVGELVDKITILEIKQKHIEDKNSLSLVNKELNSLKGTLDQNIVSEDSFLKLVYELKSINQTLWNVEDDIRDCERNKDFGEKFIELARKVYFTNDKRAKIKKEINRLTNSSIEEVKSYQDY